MMPTAHGISRSCRREKLARVPNHIQTNTPFAVDQYLRSLSVLGTERSARLTRDQFTSKHFEFIKNRVIPKELSTGPINSSTR